MFMQPKTPELCWQLCHLLARMARILELGTGCDQDGGAALHFPSAWLRFERRRGKLMGGSETERARHLSPPHGMG